MSLTAIFPEPQAIFSLHNGNYDVDYDPRTRNPQVACSLVPQPQTGQRFSRRGIKFSEDQRIPSIVRSTLRDYRGSGFDRGHMVPSGDHAYSKEAMAKTYPLTNIVPQNSSMNRGRWQRLEDHVRKLWRNPSVVSVHQCTGALYLPQTGTRTVTYEVIGPNNVAVPTHLYKVITITRGSGTTREAYVMPNEEIEKTTPLNTFRTVIEQVERLSGSLFTQAASMPQTHFKFFDGVEFGAYDRSRRNVYYTCRYVTEQDSVVRSIFDRHVQALQKSNPVVRVCEGPIYHHFQTADNRKYVQYNIDDNGRAIPTHIYKVITIENRLGQVQQEAYIFPSNGRINPPLSTFAATVDQVTRLSGVLFPFS